MKTSLIKKFRNVSADDLKADLHIHSKWTDGEQTVREIAKIAKKLHLSAIALTDHVRKGSDYCEDYDREIKKVSKESGLEIIAGFEAKVVNLKGELDLPSYCRRSRHLIIGSVHSVPLKGKIVHPKNIPTDEFQDIELKFSLAIAKGGKADILGHAGGMSIANHGSFDMGRLERIICACAKHGTAFEFNSRYHCRYVKEIRKMLLKHNPFVTFGSDAHKASEIGSCMKMAVELL